MLDKTLLKSGLTKLAGFLKKYQPIYNVCMVDFVTKDIYESVLSEEVKKELGTLSEDQVANLPKFVSSRCTDFEGKFPELSRLLQEISAHSLENLGVSISKEDFEEKLKVLAKNCKKIII